MGFRVDPGLLGPFLYGVFLLQLVGLGAFCALCSVFVTEPGGNLEDPADQTPSEREAALQHSAEHGRYIA